MPTFTELLAQGASNAWFFIPSAILLGALHGLEPGHSKTMMAAFIVAVRGTVFQAVLLGLAATVSHTLVVWAVALSGLCLVRGLDAETVEPYFQLASAVVIVAIAAWMVRRTWQDRRHARPEAGEAAAPDRDGSGIVRMVDTGHETLSLEIAGTPARFRLGVVSGERWSAEHVTATVERPGGGRQAFGFVERDGHLESAEAVPEPHDVAVRLSLDHGDHAHAYDISFATTNGTVGRQGDEEHAGGHLDAHALAHAADIRRRFTGRQATTGQIVMFGLTGGLIPCPAAITVLLLCMQIREFTLGAVLVLCFSIGLALTLVTVGVAAAVGLRHATARMGWLSSLAGRAPYFSSALIVLVGLYTGYQGWSGLHGNRHAEAMSVTAPSPG